MPEASSMDAATLKARTLARMRVILTDAGGRDSDAGTPRGRTSRA
jgi:hypothetical protein